MTISFSGIGSGTDWSSIITQLVAVEKQAATAYTKKKTDATSQLSLVTDFVSRLGSLGALGNGFASAKDLWGVTASSSDATRVAASASGTGTPGSYSLKVGKLAQGETRQSKALGTNAAGSAGAGRLSIGVGTGTPVNVDYTSADTLADLAARVNASVSGVTASALYDGTSYRIVLSSQATGKTNGLTVTDTGSALGFDASGAVVQAAADASFTLNGVTGTSSSNHVTDLIPGVTLDLKSETPVGAAATLVTVARDASTVTQKVHDLVDSYNNVARLVGSQMSFTGSYRGKDTLFGDPIVSSLQQQLGSIIARAYTHGSGQVSARDLGIKMGPDGGLTIDDSVLAGKLANDPTAVDDLFTGPSGVAAALKAVSTSFNDVTGPLVQRQNSLKAAMTGYDNQVQKINDAGAAYETRLRKQFAALDALMATYSANSSALSNITSVR